LGNTGTSGAGYRYVEADSFAMSTPTTTLPTKYAETDVPVLEPIQHRWSPRAFSPQPVEPDKLRRVFEAARWAPSSRNEQPWRFIVGVKGEGETYDRIFRSLNEWNQKWNLHTPVLILVASQTHFHHNGAENEYNLYDTGAATGYMALQATHEGLFTHQMAGIHPNEARRLLNIPAGFEARVIVSLGYRAEPDHLPEDYRKSEHAARTRKSIGEVVFGGTWGEGYF
jgi:nitroreductase